jgi:hypothetical protein
LRQRLRERRPDWLLLTYWLLVPLVVFFLARSRLQLYILPLFVPLALMMSRPLAKWPRIAGRPLLVILLLSTVVFVGLKGVLAHWPTTRDARDIGAQLTAIIDPHAVDEIVFVGMRPFYGLNVYLDKHIEGIEINEHRFDYSKFVAEDDVCDELQEHERNVYVMKASREEKFVAAVRKCGADATRLGAVRGDDNVLPVYVVKGP